MAKRYGGKYSPGEVDLQADAPDISRFRGRRAANVNVFARLMYFAPLPLLTSGLGEVSRGDALGMVAELGALVLLLSGAWLLNEGLKAENAYRARKIARPPAIPRKFLSLVATAAGVGLAAWLGAGYGLIPGIVFGAVAGAAHLFAFGLRPDEEEGHGGHVGFRNQPRRRGHRQRRRRGRRDPVCCASHRRPRHRRAGRTDAHNRPAKSSARSRMTPATCRALASFWASTCAAPETRRSNTPTSPVAPATAKPATSTWRCSTTWTEASATTGRSFWKTTARPSISRSRCCENDCNAKASEFKRGDRHV